MSSKESQISASLPVNELVAYEDKKATKKLEKIKLGRIPLGQTFEINFFFKNHSDRWPVVNITLTETAGEIKANYPDMVAPGEIAPVKLVFSPSMSRREPLRVVELFEGELWIG